MCQVTNKASLYSEKDKNYKMRQNFLIWKNPSQKIGLKNFDQNENLCETSKKNLRTNFDISLKALATALPNSKLTSLFIKNNQISDEVTRRILNKGIFNRDGTLIRIDT